MNFYTNVPLADTSTIKIIQTQFVRMLIDKMKLNGWTVVRSSDGVTLSTSDNFPSTTFSGTPWITLKSPVNIVSGGTGYIWYTFYIDVPWGAATPLLYSRLHRTDPTAGSVSSPDSSNNQLATAFIPASSYNGMEYTSINFNATFWSNGAFIATMTKLGAGYSVICISLLPITDVMYNYPYPIALKMFSTTARWTVSLFDNLSGWDANGNEINNSLRLAYLGGAFGVIGVGATATGDRGGNNLNTKLYVYNTVAGSVGIIGKIGGETCDLTATGCTAIPTGSSDANVPTRSFQGDLMIPTNAVLLS